MSTPARRRLMSDFKCLQENLIPGANAAPTNDNILKWYAVIIGPHETPFEDGTFRLSIEFTEEYPNKPPSVEFVTPIFHPNVYENGKICLDILQNRWSPIYNVSAILSSIQSLLGDPNPDSPANAEAANLLQVYAEILNIKSAMLIATPRIQNPGNMRNVYKDMLKEVGYGQYTLGKAMVNDMQSTRHSKISQKKY